MNIERLAANWDGEGAQATSPMSAAYAERFAAFVPKMGLEAMHHASGTVGLYKSDALEYVDIEFFSDGKIAYYIERGMEKITGVVSIGTPGKLIERLATGHSGD